MAGASNNNLFSGLAIGFRELFRIIVPGAYALILYKYLQLEPFIQVNCERSTLVYIAFSVFIGLIAYGFRIHETLQPYKHFYEKHRVKLNDEIKQNVPSTKDKDKDYVYEYKYFLETCAHEVNERIHYFTSFYYMLVEMSFISALAALIIGERLFYTLNPDSWLSVHFFWIAVVIQFIVGLLPISSKNRILNFVNGYCAIIILYFIVNFVGSICRYQIWPRIPFDIDWQFPTLVLVTLIFGSLATKQWKNIIAEQVILVQNKKEDLRKIFDAKTDQPH
jgi:hypothetical protein